MSEKTDVPCLLFYITLIRFWAKKKMEDELLKILQQAKEEGLAATQKKYRAPPSDPCPTDLDRILTEGQDPVAQQYLVLGTVPIKVKNLGFWVPMHFLY